MRIIQVSDTHLSASHEHFSQNNRVVSRWLSAQKADLIVHTGDLGMDCAGTLEDLHVAADWLSGFAAEIVCVPGNHDVGDRVAVKPSQPVNDVRLTQLRDVIGPDYWSLDQGGWRLIGLNAMLFDTAHPAEEEQFAWLANTISTSLPVAVFLHKPLFIDHREEGPRGYWTVPPEPRRRLLALLDQAHVRLIASGHLHIHRQRAFGDTMHVWGPAASFVCGESQEDLGGARQLGVVEHLFDGDSVTSRFIRPDGLEDLLIDPVQHVIYPRDTTHEAAQ
jgi:alkaline phosphatase D